MHERALQLCPGMLGTRIRFVGDLVLSVAGPPDRSPPCERRTHAWAYYCPGPGCMFKSAVPNPTSPPANNLGPPGRYGVGDARAANEGTISLIQKRWLPTLRDFACSGTPAAPRFTASGFLPTEDPGGRLPSWCRPRTKPNPLGTTTGPKSKPRTLQPPRDEHAVLLHKTQRTTSSTCCAIPRPNQLAARLEGAAQRASLGVGGTADTAEKFS